MAQLERTIRGNFDELLHRIEQGIMQGSVSASREAASDFTDGAARCSVRVYERYSFIGGNRLSLNVTLFQGESGEIRLSAVTAGGSQALMFKINTFGEEAFLGKLEELLDQEVSG